MLILRLVNGPRSQPVMVSGYSLRRNCPSALASETPVDTALLRIVLLVSGLETPNGKHTRSTIPPRIPAFR